MTAVLWLIAIFGTVLAIVGYYFAGRERDAAKNQSQTPMPEAPMPRTTNLDDEALRPTANIPGEQQAQTGNQPQPANRKGIRLDPQHQAH